MAATKGYEQRITVRLTGATGRKIQREAKDRGVSISRIIRERLEGAKAVAK